MTRKDDTNDVPEQEAIASTDDKSEFAAQTYNATTVGSKACSLCGVAFHTVEDQRSHVRSDLHGYNLKQRIRGANTVSEGDFENLVGGMEFVDHCRRSANQVRSG